MVERYEKKKKEVKWKCKPLKKRKLEGGRKWKLMKRFEKLKNPGRNRRSLKLWRKGQKRERRVIGRKGQVEKEGQSLAMEVRLGRKKTQIVWPDVRAVGSKFQEWKRHYRIWDPTSNGKSKCVDVLDDFMKRQHEVRISMIKKEKARPLRWFSKWSAVEFMEEDCMTLVQW